jgi:hypothetical protein
MPFMTESGIMNLRATTLQGLPHARLDSHSSSDCLRRLFFDLPKRVHRVDELVLQGCLNNKIAARDAATLRSRDLGSTIWSPAMSGSLWVSRTRARILILARLRHPST